MRLPSWLAHHLAALRALLVLTILAGLAYPLAVTAPAQLPAYASEPPARSSPTPPATGPAAD